MERGSVRFFHGDGLSGELRDRLTAAARQHGKAVLVGPVFDTIKRVHEGIVQETLDRDQLGWPLAWACTVGHEPPTDPPAAEWFLGAVILEPAR